MGRNALTIQEVMAFVKQITQKLSEHIKNVRTIARNDLARQRPN